jgi:imidazolonepropionase-like amidohydrolase
MSAPTTGCLVLLDATVIDGVADSPAYGSIRIDSERITSIGTGEIDIPPDARTIDCRGKYVIPGLMNANVHLFMALSVERFARHLDNYEDLILEAAQVTLKNGLTTVFDTWGPRRALISVRDRINAGEVNASRIFCAGNIVGFDGPFSLDFMPKGEEVASPYIVQRVNATWVENVGRRLMWLPPAEVASELRAYVAKGIDFVKYASNDHAPGAFIAFSPRTQAAIVDEAHRAGLTAQAHTMSVEGLRIAIEAGCDLIQHANITGPAPIPPETLELMDERGTNVVLFPFPERGMEWLRTTVSDRSWTIFKSMDVNVRGILETRAVPVLGTDGSLLAPESLSDPLWKKTWGTMPEEFGLVNLASGHFNWLQGMEEKGFPPMEMLRAATRNVAAAYGKEKVLGTIEPGKIADLLILDRNPLEAARNYRSIYAVIKDGSVVDVDSLPANPILTAPFEPPLEEEASYVPFQHVGARFPMCPMCIWGQ